MHLDRADAFDRQRLARDDFERGADRRVAGQDRRIELEAVLQDFPALAQARSQRFRFRLQAVGGQVAFRVAEDVGRAAGAEFGQGRRQHAVHRGLARMQALRVVARFEKGIQAARLGAGETEGGAHALGIERGGLGGGGGAAEGAVGGGRVPETVVARHHRHADPRRHLVAGHQRGDQVAAVAGARLGRRQRGRHHHRAEVRQRALVGVVVVGGVDQHAVRQRGQRRMGFRAADHGRLCLGAELVGELYRDLRLPGVFLVGGNGAAESIQQEALGLLHDFGRQVVELQSGDKIRHRSGQGIGHGSSFCVGNRAGSLPQPEFLDILQLYGANFRHKMDI